MFKTKYKLIGVRAQNQLLNPNSDSEPYVLTYLTKPWYLFGGVRKIEEVVQCSDRQSHIWLKQINEKIEKGEWRTN